MLLFRAEEHVHLWCRARDLPICGMMTPEQGWRLAHEWFKDRLKPDWRRFTPDETRSVFASVGLTGNFWKI